MTISIVQTDSAASCSAAVLCASGASLHANALEALCQEGGSAGSGADNVDMGTAALTDNVGYMYDCVIPAGASWDAGTWTIPINFTNGHMDITLDQVRICRVNSSCVNQESLGSESGIGFNTAGGQTTRNITGSSVASPSAGDRVAIVLVFDKASSHSSRSFDITPNQTITCPFTVAATGIANQLPLLGVG